MGTEAARWVRSAPLCGCQRQIHSPRFGSPRHSAPAGGREFPGPEPAPRGLSPRWEAGDVPRPSAERCRHCLHPPAAAGSLLPGAGPMPGGLCHPGGCGREGMDSPAARTGSPSSASSSGNQDPSKQHIYGGGRAAARLPGASPAAAVPREDSGTEPHRPLCPHHARARDVPLGAGDMGQPGEQSWGRCHRDSDGGWCGGDKKGGSTTGWSCLGRL